MAINVASRRFGRFVLLSATALVAWPALAQDQGAAATRDEDAEIIVTGTNVERTAVDTPLAVTAFSSERLAKLTSNSQADILNAIPTIKADGGGGEVATNVFIRGLPSGGQFQFTPLMYDGMPVFSTFGLNSSAFDVFYRNDLGIDRMEFVRGGVSNLFGAGSVAGLINYISTSGDDEHHGTVQLQGAEVGRVRGDVALSGPLGQGFYYAVSGYYRTDDGPVRTGNPTEGWQLRGNIKKEFSDGSGKVVLYGQYIDDKVQFFLPIPLNGTTRARVPGNDGEDVQSVSTSAVTGQGFNVPGGGRYTTRIADGVQTRGGAVALAFDKSWDSGWGINGRMKFASYAHRFGLFSDGDGVVNVPESLQGFLTNRNLGNLANASFTFQDGSAVPTNFLVFANRWTDRERPAKDFTGELNVTRKFETGSLEHNLTLGGFVGRAEAKDYNVTGTYLGELNNEPRLINLTVTNPTTGARTVISQNGLLNAGAGYVNNEHEAVRVAGYFADQMQSDKLVIDVGVRVEKLTGDIRRERTSVFITDSTTPNLSAALRDVIWGNGIYQQARVDTTEWAAAIGVLYKLTDDFNLYANASRGYFFPELRSVTFNALGQAASYEGEIIKQAEAGVKFSNSRITATLAGLYTKLDNRRQVLFVNDGAGGLTERVNIVATESYGLEGTLSVKLLDSLTFSGNATWTHHEYTDFDTAPANIGNELERQPNFLYNAGLYYDDGSLDASIFTNYTGSNYTAANNAILLDGWNIVTADAGYKFDFGEGRGLRVGFNVFNLLNTDAVTEGSPRQDAQQTAGGAFFVGRPVLPRRISARATFTF